MSVNYIDIPGRLRSVALDGQVAGANQLYDDDRNMFQSVINELINAHINDSSIHFSPEEKDNIENVGKIISIIGLSVFTCSSEKVTNPEWEYVMLDASSHVLAGVRHDHEIVVNADLDEILTYITPPSYGLIDVHDDVIDVSVGLYNHIHDSSAHLSNEDVLKLSYICTFSTLNGSFEQNPEWKQIILDASNHILAGVNNDNQAYLYAGIDEIFNIIEAPEYSIVDHVEDASIHITQIERDAWNLQADWNETDASSLAYILHKPTSLPASDVSTWAKADTKPSYTKSEVGLGNVTNDSQVKRSEMGAANGVATLDSNGVIPSSQLPSYVDDVLEYDSSTSFPSPGTDGKIYVDKTDNKQYRWSGSIYVEISKSIVVGTTTGTALDGSIGNAHINNSNIHVTSSDKTNWNGKVSNVAYDTTGKKITKTINGTTSDVVSASTIVTDGGGIKNHQSVTDNNPTLSWGQKSKVATIGSTDINVTMPANPNSDTKNTAGSTNNTSKLFLIGAQTQAANPQTYSRVNCFIDASGYIYSGGSRTITFDDTLTADQIGVITAIASLAESTGGVSVVTNPEYQWVVIDASSHILVGIRTDGTLYAASIDVLTEALQIMVSSYSGQKSGTFANKPSNPYVGQQYFCTDKTATGGTNNGIPIWYNGTGWVDAIGNMIS